MNLFFNEDPPFARTELTKIDIMILCFVLFFHLITRDFHSMRFKNTGSLILCWCALLQLHFCGCEVIGM